MKTKSEVEAKYYVLRVFNFGFTPTVIEVFPHTPEGYKDAVAFAEILERTKNARYIVVG